MKCEVCKEKEATLKDYRFVGSIGVQGECSVCKDCFSRSTSGLGQIANTLQELFGKGIYGLNRLELIAFIEEYNRYVIECYEDDMSKVPVCVDEFFENDYPIIMGREKA